MISRKLLGAAALSLFATVASAAYPERDVTGTIMWGAGGAMDVVSRAIQPHAEAALGIRVAEGIGLRRRRGGDRRLHPRR